MTAITGNFFPSLDGPAGSGGVFKVPLMMVAEASAGTGFDSST